MGADAAGSRATTKPPPGAWNASRSMVWPLLHSACRPGTALSWRNCAGVLAAAAAGASQSSVHADRIGAPPGAGVYGQRALSRVERRKADRCVACVAAGRARPAGALHVTACGRFYLDDFGPPTAPDREKRAARRSHATCRSRAVLRVVFPCLQPPLTPASLTSSAHLRFSPRTKA